MKMGLIILLNIIIKDQDPKRMQINLTGFLESKTQSFLSELWNLLLSAQNSVGGIPTEFIEQKKQELRRKQTQEDERRAQRDSVMDTIRQKKTDEFDALQEARKRSSRFVSLFNIQYCEILLIKCIYYRMIEVIVVAIVIENIVGLLHAVDIDLDQDHLLVKIDVVADIITVMIITAAVVVENVMRTDIEEAEEQEITETVEVEVQITVQIKNDKLIFINDPLPTGLFMDLFQDFFLFCTSLNIWF